MHHRTTAFPKKEERKKKYNPIFSSDSRQNGRFYATDTPKLHPLSFENYCSLEKFMLQEAFSLKNLSSYLKAGVEEFVLIYSRCSTKSEAISCFFCDSVPH